ncbi:hypothetical protein [Shewanella sp. 10N.286.54.B9]|uniref:hypothetical protein n=1 Tax=Shewanella sp. 10N.286.54.B9 TaxID=3229719 RepID=UPI0035536C81
MNQKFLWASYVLLVAFCIFFLFTPSKLANTLFLETQQEGMEERSKALDQMIAKPNYKMDSEVVADLLQFELEQSKQHYNDTKAVLRIQYWLGLILGGLLLVHLSALLSTRKYKQ